MCNEFSLAPVCVLPRLVCARPVRASLFALSAILALVVAAGAQDVTTWHNDMQRSGSQPKEVLLTPANVNANQFGKVFSLLVTGDVYAQPLYLSQYIMNDGQAHNVLIVATAQDYIYAFDADGNNPTQGYLWCKSLLGPGETWISDTDVNTSDITPSIGIIGTPVIDRTGGTIYVVAASKDTSGSVPAFHQRLHALNIADGSEELNGPTEISATLPGSGDGGTSVSFDPLLENQRAALLLAPTPGVGSGNSVFIAWGSHGDHGSYHGWIMAYDAANIALQNGVWLSTPNGIGGGVWMSGGGPSSDGRGNIFAASGNGTFDADASGSDYGDSAFRLLFSGSGLQLADYFTPADESSLNTGDHDMGMSAPIVLPTEVGPIPHLTMTTDKNGTLYLLNRDNMGEFGTPDDDSVQSISTGYHIHSSAAFFNNVLYLGLDNGPLQAWKLDTATDQLVPQSATSTVFITPAYSGGGGTTSISSNGTSQRIAWIIQDTDFNVGPAILHAYNAANLSQELYNSAQAANSRDAAAIAVKFTTPTIANGRVYVGGRNAVTVYGLLSTSSPCTAPSGGGINVCSPAENSTVTSPVAVEAAASISGDIYRFSLWNNSTKLLDERNTGIMDDSVTLAPGSYTLTFVASNTAGVHEYTKRDITVSGGACAAPSSDGVNVCSPSGGATVGSAFTVQASATVTGGVYRFELWANGTKVYTVRDSGIMEATISLEPGSYSLDFIARNTAGEHVSKSISVTVQ